MHNVQAGVECWSTVTFETAALWVWDFVNLLGTTNQYLLDREASEKLRSRLQTGHTKYCVYQINATPDSVLQLEKLSFPELTDFIRMRVSEFKDIPVKITQSRMNEVNAMFFCFEFVVITLHFTDYGSVWMAQGKIRIQRICYSKYFHFGAVWMAVRGRFSQMWLLSKKMEFGNIWHRRGFWNRSCGPAPKMVRLEEIGSWMGVVSGSTTERENVGTGRPETEANIWSCECLCRKWDVVSVIIKSCESWRHEGDGDYLNKCHFWPVLTNGY